MPCSTEPSYSNWIRVPRPWAFIFGSYWVIINSLSLSVSFFHWFWSKNFYTPRPKVVPAAYSQVSCCATLGSYMHQDVAWSTLTSSLGNSSCSIFLSLDLSTMSPMWDHHSAHRGNTISNVVASTGLKMECQMESILLLLWRRVFFRKELQSNFIILFCFILNLSWFHSWHFSFSLWVWALTAVNPALMLYKIFHIYIKFITDLFRFSVP